LARQHDRLIGTILAEEEDSFRRKRAPLGGKKGREMEVEAG
jgi:hypothetical protein